MNRIRFVCLGRTSAPLGAAYCLWPYGTNFTDFYYLVNEFSIICENILINLKPKNQIR